MGLDLIPKAAQPRIYIHPTVQKPEQCGTPVQLQYSPSHLAWVLEPIPTLQSLTWL